MAGCICLLLPLPRRPSPSPANGSASPNRPAKRLRAAGVSRSSLFLAFRPPGLLATQVSPTAAQLLTAQGSRDFYPRATTRTVTSTGIGMLAVRIRQLTAKDFHLLDLQPCRPLPGICTRWMTIRGFANSSSVPPLPSFSERDPDVISAKSFLGCLGPCHDASTECTCLFLPPRHRPSPVPYRGRLPAFPRRNDFPTDLFFGTAAISLCSGPQVCSPPRSFLPLRLIVAGQPRLLRPSRTCFVASTCIGYANHPPRPLVVWGLTPH